MLLGSDILDEIMLPGKQSSNECILHAKETVLFEAVVFPRKIASDVAKTLGWLAPCTIVVKVLMQDLGRLKSRMTQFLTILHKYGISGEKNFLSSSLIPYHATTWSE